MPTIIPPTMTLSPADLEALALFPLPNAVFFPHTLLPLHIFEPRYRQMIAHAIERQAPIAVCMLKPGYEAAYEGHPAIYDVAGVGHIIHHELLPDGRYNIILRGLARVRVLEELTPEHLYRQARAELIDDAREAPGEVEAQMTTLRGCVFGLSTHRPRLAALLSRRLGTLEDPGALADNIASLLLPDQHQRLSMLSEARTSRRLEAINAFLTELLLDTPTEEPELLN